MQRAFSGKGPLPGLTGWNGKRKRAGENYDDPFPTERAGTASDRRGIQEISPTQTNV